MINIDELLNFPDNSITDPEIIRQIAMIVIERKHSEEITNSLIKKIKEEFQFAGLYPY